MGLKLALATLVITGILFGVMQPELNWEILLALPVELCLCDCYGLLMRET